MRKVEDEEEFEKNLSLLKLKIIKVFCVDLCRVRYVASLC